MMLFFTYLWAYLRFVVTLARNSYKRRKHKLFNNSFYLIMRKLFTILFVAAMSISASAQFAGTKFFDNWSIGVQAGAITSLEANYEVQSNKAFGLGAFWGGMRPSFGIEITKQLTPGFALSIQDHAVINWTDSRNVIDVNDIVLNGKVNFMNWLLGYKGHPRCFEIEGVVGVGTRMYLAHGAPYIGIEQPFVVGAKGGNPAVKGDEWKNFADDDAWSSNNRNNWIVKTGANFLFNLGQRRLFSLQISPAVVWDMDGFPKFHESGSRFQSKYGAFELTAGLNYHFRSSNDEHYMTLVKPYNQAEIDGLNSRINDLRDELNGKNNQIEDLENELNDLRNRKPEVIEKVVNAQKGLVTNVWFPLDKWVITASQVPNVEKIATYLKQYPNSKVDIKGYASKEGPIKRNQLLGVNRAEAVKKMLIEKYGINASRISASGHAVSEAFEILELNRVSICTIPE